MSTFAPQVIYGGLGFGEVAGTYRGAARTRLSTGWDRQIPYRNGSVRNRLQLQEMRDRAIEVYENNAIARGLLDTEVTNVVADKYRLQARAKGADGKLSKAFNDEAEDRWNDWFERCDVRGVLSGGQFQRNAYRSSRRDGVGGIVLVDVKGFSKLQFIPASNICTPDDKVGDLSYVNGVQVDATNTPIAFHVLDVDGYGKRTFTPIAAGNFVYLVPELDDDNGLVGPSCYSTIFGKLDMLDRFIDGVGVAATMATVFGLMIKSDDKVSDFKGLRTVLNGDGVQQRALTIENGMIKLLNAKDSVVQVDAKQPLTQTPDWIRAQMRLIGLPFNMPVELVALDSSASTFATWRGQVLMYYRACYARMDFYRGKWSRIYQWWISREQKRQAAGLPNAFTTPFPLKFWDHQFHTRAWSYTDPIRDPQSAFMQIDMGILSPQQAAAERGGDYEEIQIQIAAAMAMRRALNLPTDIRSTLSRDLVTVKATDIKELGTEDAGKQDAQDKADGYDYTDGEDDE